MSNDLRHCSRCGCEQLISEFYVRKDQSLNPWCKSCYRDWYAKRSGGQVERACDYCGNAMEVTGRRAAEPRVHCSRSCKDKARNARWAVENKAKKPAVRTCVSCGKDMPASKRSDAKYCTDQCGEAARNVSRYNKTRGAEIDELFTLDEIFERDAGVCYLCHQDCPREKASMEHVVPIGSPHYGPHSRENVRLAHVRCKPGRATSSCRSCPGTWVRSLFEESPWLMSRSGRSPRRGVGAVRSIRIRSPLQSQSPSPSLSRRPSRRRRPSGSSAPQRAGGRP